MPASKDRKKRRAAPPSKIISGGQTGVDRAGLDVAIELGIPHGGWCPRGRLAEDGRIPERYKLEETSSAEYAIRTARNVLDADATLILTRGVPTGGTLLTLKLAQRHNKPHLVLDLGKAHAVAELQRWLRAGRYGTLNVAGPRESQNPGIGSAAAGALRQALTNLCQEAEAPRPTF